MVLSSENTLLAFVLVTLAGACTCIGAALVFLIRKPKPVHLALSLGAAAGVMLFVSMVDLIGEGTALIHEGTGGSETAAYNYTVLAFFGGVLLIVALQYLVGLMMKVKMGQSRGVTAVADDEETLDEFADPTLSAAFEVVAGKPSQGLDCISSLARHESVHLTSEQAEVLEKVLEVDDMAATLQEMGLLTALAIFIHNWPEGITGFVGTIAGGAAVGVPLAVAIALHNIPEGVCVAMPIYYATGSKLKAFGWAALAGAAEPVGGLIAFLALSGDENVAIYGAIYAVTAGMMTAISIKELLPTAFCYSDTGRSVFWSCMVGMAVMAASIGLMG